MIAFGDQSESRRPLFMFAFLAALLLVAVFFGIRQIVRADMVSRLGDRELRITQVFQIRIAARIRSLFSRIRGAELLIGSNPPSAATARRALVFAMNEESSELVHSAAVVLDEKGRILASRRRKGMPPPGSTEKDIWSQAVAAMRNYKRGKGRFSGEVFHIEAGAIQGVSVLFFAAPSPSTKGYWGIIFPAEYLLTIEPGEIGSKDSLFLLAEPDQIVLYARQGIRFLHDSIGRPFERGLGPDLNILACCEASAFNTLHEGRRWMSETSLSGGTREFRVVRISETATDASNFSRADAMVGGGLLAGWVVLLLLFSMFRRGAAGQGGAAESGILTSGPNIVDAVPSNTPFESLSRISEFVARGDHFRDVIEFGTREIAKFIRANRCYSALYDDELDQIFEISCSNVSDGYRQAIAIGSGELPEHIAVQEKDFVEVPSVKEWDEAPESLRDEGIGAVVVFPMRVGDKIVGLMSFYFDKPRELRPEEAEICSFFALQCAGSVARALSAPEPPAER